MRCATTVPGTDTLSKAALTFSLFLFPFSLSSPPLVHEDEKI